MAEIIGYEDFYAVCDHMPGADRALRVGGKVVVPTGGWSAKLRKHEKDGPPGINPFILELDLIITAPSPDTGVPDVVRHEEIEEFRIEDPATEYEEVHFYLVDRDGEKAPPSIDVEHPE